METTAHKLDEKERTSDIRLSEKVPFNKMILSNGVRNGLNRAGYVFPTVLQANAIPIGKARIDLIIQSKSGTGKTLIFAVVLLESCDWGNGQHPQALVLTPTREIAVQIESTLNVLGSSTPGFKAISVIGGLEVTADRKRIQNAGAIVGTPGRVLHLIQNDVLNTSNIKLFILDEADKMLSSTFRIDFEKIHNSLPAKKQMIACSATFSNELDSSLATYMRNPFLISTDKRAATLVGIKQLVYELDEEKSNILDMNAKIAALKQIFTNVSFKQCLIFTNSQSRAESYRSLLDKDGWPCEVMSAAHDQKIRLEVFCKFREFKTRTLVSTDLMSRGIDSEHVNLVVNLEVPDDSSTYLHRIGRAGRFGSHGIAVTLIASEKDRIRFRRLLNVIGTQMEVLKYPKEKSLDLWKFDEPTKERELLGVFDVNQSFDCEKENLSDNSQISSNRSSLEANGQPDEKPIANEKSPPPDLLQDANNRARCLSNSKRNCLQIEQSKESFYLPCDSPNSTAENLIDFHSPRVNKLDILKELVDAKPVKRSVKLDPVCKAPKSFNPFDDYVQSKESNGLPEVGKEEHPVEESFSPCEQISVKEENSISTNRANIPDDLKESLQSVLVEPQVRRQPGNIFEEYGNFTVSTSNPPNASPPAKKTIKQAIQEVRECIVSSSDSRLPSGLNFSDPQPSTSSQTLDTSLNTIKSTSSPVSTVSSPYPNTTSFTSANQTGRDFNLSTTTDGKNCSQNFSDPSLNAVNPGHCEPSNPEPSSTSEDSSSDSDSSTDTATEENNQESSGFDERQSGASSGVVTTEEEDSAGVDSSSHSATYSESVYEDDTLAESVDSTDSESEVEVRRRSRSRRNQEATYQSSFANWSEMYWNQVTHIQDYVRFSEYAKIHAVLYNRKN